jgi:hypothetical protein
VLAGLNQVLKIGWNIVNSDSSIAANRLQALALINDSYKYLMDLTTNGVVIIDAIKYVTQKQEQISTVQKLDKRIEAVKEEREGEEAGEKQTTNGVF